MKTVRNVHNVILIISLLFIMGFSVVGCAGGKSEIRDTRDQSSVVSSQPSVVSNQLPVISGPSHALRPQPLEMGSYIIGPEDILDIRVLRHEDLAIVTQVQANGMITYPFIGDIKAAGLTIHELQKDIIKRLSRYVKEPFVTVLVKEFNSKKVFILGEVRAPGVYPLKRYTTLLEELTLAGGITDKADLSSAYIVRGVALLPVDFGRLFLQADLSQNIPLAGNDFIYIPSLAEKRVYVLGEVIKPGVVEGRSRLTLVDAISSTGGFKVTAVKNSVKIIRGDLKNPEIIDIDVEAVLSGKALDNPILKGGDIIYVPATRLAKWNEFLTQILPTLQAINLGLTPSYYFFSK